MKTKIQNPTNLVATSENVLPYYLWKSAEGQRVCLVTIIHVVGTSPRPVGSQIAVSEDGESFGFVTGGCAQSAIVHEALMALKENRSRTIRIGSDSPWFDIKLPCGAGIDLYFSVADSSDIISSACQKLLNRQAVDLCIDMDNDTIDVVLDDHDHKKSERNFFTRSYLPVCQLNIFGTGPYVESLTNLANHSDFDVSIWTPDVDAVPIQNANLFSLTRVCDLSQCVLDRWTAAVLLFHEHDWEPKLLKSVLESDCFYVGALGSRKTHQNRLLQLRQLGLQNSELERIRGPVGLDIGAKTPSEIALSILAEIVMAKNEVAIHRI